MSGGGPIADFASLDGLLQQALDLAPDARDAFAEAACGGDQAKLKALRNLLAHCDDDEPTWETPATRFAIAETIDPMPSQIDGWTVLDPIGEGGMARVFLAQRNVEGAQQFAALKVLWSHRASPALRARFARERRILADLSDPRIARFYDAGVLDDGRPWLAMEYIEGIRIDQWCDAQQYSIPARLRLLMQVAHAVASAHARLVVHRDIKPANVLVGADGTPKLLDFGIAKILETDNPADHTDTQTEQRVLTPQYASPEQLLGDPVGTSSDIYQLGLMLFELCTGSRPFQALESSLPRLMRAVTEGPAISLQRAYEDSAQATLVAAQRDSTTARLRWMLRGDLRLIAAKALAQDPAERYASATHFAEDIGRYLTSQPLSAAAPTWRYRVLRLLTRHPWVAGLVTALLLAVALGTGSTWWQMREALHQRDQAQLEAAKSARLTEFLVGAFAEANPTRTQGEAVSAKALLDAAVDRINLELPERDQTRSDLLAAMSSAYSGLALRPPQWELAQEALAIERTLNRPEILTRRIGAAASAAREVGEYAVAMTLLLEAESRLRADLSQSRGYFGWLLYTKALTEFSLNDSAQSERTLEQALEVLRTAADARPQDVVAVQLMLTRRWATAGKFEAAIDLVQSVVTRYRAAQPPQPTQLLEALDALGSAYEKSGRMIEQITTYREAIALARQTYGPAHLNVAILSHNLALALEKKGDLTEAEALLKESVAIARAAVGPTHAFSLAARMAWLRLRCRTDAAPDRQSVLAALLIDAAKLPRLQERLAQTKAICGL